MLLRDAGQPPVRAVETQRGQPSALTGQDTLLLTESLDAFLKELPKHILGNPAKRSENVSKWLAAVTTAMLPVHKEANAWWRWCRTSAINAMVHLQAADLNTQASVWPADPLPDEWIQLEAILRPKLLAAMPKDVTDMIDAKGVAGHDEPSNFILFRAMRHANPGGPEDTILLTDVVLEPNPCSAAKPALLELVRWKEH